MDKKFDLNDIVLIPAEESDITSRTECKIESYFNEHQVLPIMASPMDTVISPKNYELFIKNGIIPCIPRGQDIPFSPLREKSFKAFGLSEIEKHMPVGLYTSPLRHYPNILIDIANGHMSKLIPIIKQIKRYYPDTKLMVGNVANPETFVNLANAGADYVRISIGTGCFMPGQSIKTSGNGKNIENIKIGDKVLTHKNTFQKVKNKFEYEIKEEIYNIIILNVLKIMNFML